MSEGLEPDVPTMTEAEAVRHCKGTYDYWMSKPRTSRRVNVLTTVFRGNTSLNASFGKYLHKKRAHFEDTYHVDFRDGGDKREIEFDLHGKPASFSEPLTTSRKRGAAVLSSNDTSLEMTAADMRLVMEGGESVKKPSGARGCLGISLVWSKGEWPGYFDLLNGDVGQIAMNMTSGSSFQIYKPSWILECICRTANGGRFALRHVDCSRDTVGSEMHPVTGGELCLKCYDGIYDHRSIQRWVKDVRDNESRISGSLMSMVSQTDNWFMSLPRRLLNVAVLRLSQALLSQPAMVVASQQEEVGGRAVESQSENARVLGIDEAEEEAQEQEEDTSWYIAVPEPLPPPQKLDDGTLVYERMAGSSEGVISLASDISSSMQPLQLTAVRPPPAQHDNENHVWSRLRMNATPACDAVTVAAQVFAALLKETANTCDDSLKELEKQVKANERPLNCYDRSLCSIMWLFRDLAYRFSQRLSYSLAQLTRF